MPIAGLSIGLSALQTDQRALEILGNNIANANTPGYHLQVAQLVKTPPNAQNGLSFGSGVDIADITRQRDALLEQAITSQTSQSSNTNAQLDALQQLQTQLAPGDNDVGTLLENFFNQLEQLSSQPSDTAQRQIVLGAASALTSQFNSLASSLEQTGNGIISQLNGLTSQVNTLSGQIAALNGDIANSEGQGIQANDESDKHDQLINQLAGLVNVQTVTQPLGQTNVIMDGVPLVEGNQSTNVQFSEDQPNDAVLTAQGSQEPLNITGGQIGALLQVNNQVLPSYQQSLNTLAQSLMQGMDGIQATGLGLEGPVTSMSGLRSVSNVTTPLANANPNFPIQAGSLFINVTNLATGQQTLNEVKIDPTTQSLTDVASAISGVGHLQAVANSQTGTLQIQAQSGYAFDFAGQIPTAPQTSTITGTAVPQIGGTYMGTSNDAYTFNVVGSGTVGVSSGLSLQVLNSAGTQVASLNIGQGYSPGSTLQVANGVTVQLSEGTVNAGDSLSTQVVAQPDTTGILTALGLNTFFTGSTATNIQVNPNLLAQPDLLAASRSGQSADGSNLQAMVALSNNPVLANGTQTFSQFYAAMQGDVGTQVQTLTQTQSANQLVTQNLQAQQQSVSGVDTNAEMIQMLDFQQAYQAAAKYVSTINNTMNTLMQIL